MTRLPLFLRSRLASRLSKAQLCARTEDAEMAERLADFLRLRHPANTAKLVARETGISHKTIKNWLAKATAPKTPHFLKLLNVYGLELLEAVAPDDLSWLEGIRTADEHRALVARLDEVLATAARIRERDQ
ncbi:hypothetical protein [Breoghania sp.]|uniref:hypothetical protein n=1 Tax=Breoghania sp. TaxID=2065378 RepID=UPI002AA71B26|nr:hypothetical protein [Breoghania sp.]